MFHVRLSIVCFLIFNITQTEFKRTRDEELREFSRYKCIQKYDMCSENDVQNMYDIYLANVKDEEKYLITTDEFYNRTGHDVLDVQIAFNRLKKFMSIPDEVQLFVDIDDEFIGSNNAIYASYRRSVVLNKRLLNNCRSKLLFILIHELTHCQQHMMRNSFFQKSISQFDQEREADIQAATVIQCPSCLWRIQIAFMNHGHELEGYFGVSDFKKYMNRKLFNDLCDGCKKNSSDLGLYLSNIDCSGCKLKK